jgi:acyl-CoA dehydrogenase
MNFQPTERGSELLGRLADFMKDQVATAEPVYRQQVRDSGDPHFQPPVMQELKEAARERGLWNLFHPEAEWGAALSNVDYAPMAELMGRSSIAAEACNCSAPDTGNMEVLHLFGSERQRERWLVPLVNGEIRSAFAMTERGVASSDARNIQLSIVRDGDEYVLNGRKWWASNAWHPNCQILIVMGKTDPNGPPRRQQSMILVPIDTAGVHVVRDLTVFGYTHHEGHGEIAFEDVRVPAENLIGEEGAGFAIAQARLGPGRVHHCMRTLGAAEIALGLLCERASERTTFGEALAERANIQDWIAEARIEIEMARLLTLKTAWLMDTVGARGAAVEVAAIKVAVPQVALRVIDRAIQVFGAAGVSGDYPLAEMWAYIRTVRIADGPDEVHKRSIARHELARFAKVA